MPPDYFYNLLEQNLSIAGVRDIEASIIFYTNILFKNVLFFQKKSVLCYP